MPACIRLFSLVPAGHDGPAGHHEVVEDARGGSSGATPSHTKSVSRDTLDSMGDVNHAHEGTSKNFPYFEY